MSPSSAELLRQVKSQIEEIDPAEVHELIGHAEGDANADRSRTGAAVSGEHGV